MLMKRIVVGGIGIACLVACAPPMPASEAPENKVMSWEKREIDVNTITRWTISGAMAARTAQKGWSASVNWQQLGAGNYKIRLFGPLGSGNVIIKGRGGSVTYQDGNKRETASNASSLLKKQTGVSVPVNSLYYWVRGIPAPGGASGKKYDKYNHLKSFNQNGYHVQYLRYTSFKGVDLPSSIKLIGGGIKIKFIIKSWSL